MTKKHIEECIRDSLEAYFKDLRGVEPGLVDGVGPVGASQENTRAESGEDSSGEESATNHYLNPRTRVS